MENYKEKYKQALDPRAKKLQKTCDSQAVIGWCEYLFPELKESEDEKIRKKLICFVENWKNFRPNSPFDDYAVYTSDSGECDKILAWLEKQGFNKEQTNLPCFTFDDILALQCCMETVKKVQEDKDLYEKLNDLHGRVYDAYHFEKQGDISPTEDELEALRIAAY